MRPALRCAIYRVFILGIAIGLALAGFGLWIHGDREAANLALLGFGVISLGLMASVWISERGGSRSPKRPD